MASLNTSAALALHRRVLRHPLAHLADAEVVGRELGDLAAAAEERRGVPASPSLRGSSRPCTTACSGSPRSSASRISRGLLGGDVESLAEAVGLHAVCEAVVHDLGEPPLRTRRRFASATWNTAAAVAVCTSAPRSNASIRPGILGQVREDAQLDLRVVGGEQARTLVGDERACAARARRQCARGRSGGSAARSRSGRWWYRSA